MPLLLLLPLKGGSPPAAAFIPRRWALLHCSKVQPCIVLLLLLLLRLPLFFSTLLMARSFHSEALHTACSVAKYTRVRCCCHRCCWSCCWCCSSKEAPYGPQLSVKSAAHRLQCGKVRLLFWRLYSGWLLDVQHVVPVALGRQHMAGNAWHAAHERQYTRGST